MKVRFLPDMKIVLLFFMLFNYSFINAQAPVIEWQKTLGGQKMDMAEDMQLTPDGGYIVVGQIGGYIPEDLADEDVITELHGSEDIWVVKLDKDGNIQWQKTLGTSLSDDAYSIQLTSDGGYIIAGRTGKIFEYKAYFIKLDSTGNVSWEKTSNELGPSRSVQQTSDGGYIAVGEYGSAQFYIVKLNIDGDVLWKRISESAAKVYSVCGATEGDGYVIAGTLRHTLSSGYTGGYCGLVFKVDHEGNIQWEKTYGQNDDGFEQVNDIQQTTDGGYILVGEKNMDGSRSRDYWLIKLNNTGELEWEQTYGGTDLDIANSVRQTIDGGYVIAGYAYANDGDVTNNHGFRDFWIVKTDSNGKLQWQKTLGGSMFEEAEAIVQTPEGDYVVAGYTRSNDGDVTGLRDKKAISLTNLNDFWIVKLNNLCSISLKAGESINVTTCGVDNGNIKFTTNLPNGSYTFKYKKNDISTSVTVSVNSGSFTLDGLSGGSYTSFSIIYNDCAGNDNSTRILSSPSIPTLAAGETTHPSICGENNGNIKFATNLPDGSYKLIFTKNGENTSVQVTVSKEAFILSGLSGGVFADFSITYNGCEANDNSSRSLSSPSIPTITAGEISHPTTCEGNNGSIKFTTNLPDGSYSLKFTKNGESAFAQVIVNKETFVLNGLHEGIFAGFSIMHNGCEGYDHRELTLYDPEKPSATASNTGPYFVGETIRFSADGGTSYIWEGPQGYTSNSQNPEIINATLNDNGVYWVTVTNINNCKARVSTEVKINIPLAAERELKGLEVSVFPNPAEDYLNAEVKSVRSTTVKMELFSSEGRLLKTWDAEREEQTHQHRFDIPAVWKGQQLLLKVSGGKETTTRKIFIQ